MLTSVVSQNPVYVYFQPDEQTYLRYAALSRKGQRPDSANPVRVGLASDTGFPYSGEVTSSTTRSTSATGTINLRATVPNPDRVFIPGLYARVQLEGSAEFKAMLIDNKAIMTDQDRKYVYVVGPKGEALRKDITLGGLRRWAAHRAVRTRTRGQGYRRRPAEDLLPRRAGEGRRGDYGRAASATCRAGRAGEHAMNFSKFFIDRPIFAAVLSIVIFVAGMIAIPLLPISEYPEVVPPTVVVTATYPGANPKVIAETVSVPLEEQINGAEHMMYMKSVAGSDGVLQMTITFEPGTDPSRAQVDVQNRVAQAQSRLPSEVVALGVTRRSSPRPLPSWSLRTLRTAATMRSTCVTTPTSRSRTNSRACVASARYECSAAAITRCAFGSIQTRSPRAA